jgi:predicted transcriptional regulator
MADVDDEVLLKPYRRGVRKFLLIRDLAGGELTQVEIAEKYGISQPAVYQFIQRNKAEIDRVKADLEDKLSQLWIARKEARIAQYQGYNEQLTDLAELVEDEKVPGVLKTAMTALRSVAEELGHLAPKDNGEATKIDVHLHGVDTDKL